MSALSLRLPNSLHKQLRELARKEGVSINQLVNSAVAEKMAALMTVDYLKERAERGSRQKFEGALAQVPDVEAQEGDQLPGAVSRRRRASGSKGRKS
jgi:predicted transcriptional regulator